MHVTLDFEHVVERTVWHRDDEDNNDHMLTPWRGVQWKASGWWKAKGLTEGHSLKQSANEGPLFRTPTPHNAPWRHRLAKSFDMNLFDPNPLICLRNPLD